MLQQYKASLCCGEAALAQSHIHTLLFTGDADPATAALCVSFVCAGKDRSMLIPNCLFRSNGSAVLLSNRPCDASSAKYSIKHLVRTNLAADDVAFNCVMQTEDVEGKVSGDRRRHERQRGQIHASVQAKSCCVGFSSQVLPILSSVELRMC
jgi:hypothetical protein